MPSIDQTYNIPAGRLAHACITTVQKGSPQSHFDQSRDALEALLQKHGTTPAPTPLHLNLSSERTRKAAVTRLTKYCQLSDSDATTLVNKFSLSRRSFRAVFFGKTGTGLSSVINLMAGRKVAKVSDGLKSETRECRAYVDVKAGLHKFYVWDTVGLDGTYSVDTVPEIIVNLIHDLQSQGGIDLLVFCIAGSTPEVEHKVLAAFIFLREFLCKSQIPVGFIITHLEQASPMETWWVKNGEKLLETLGMKTHAVTGHACITALPENPHDQTLEDKLRLSEQSVLAMLEDSISYGGSAFHEVVRDINILERKRITAGNIKNRCQVGESEAEKLTKYLYPSKGWLGHLMLSIHRLLAEFSSGVLNSCLRSRQQKADLSVYHPRIPTSCLRPLALQMTTGGASSRGLDPMPVLYLLSNPFLAFVVDMYLYESAPCFVCFVARCSRPQQCHGHACQ